MTTEELILEKIRSLPPEKQSELLEFADTLNTAAQVKAPLRSPKGLWAGFDIDISANDISELRREIRKNFPREF